MSGRETYLPYWDGRRLDSYTGDGPAGSDPDLVHQQLFTELGPLRAAVMHHASGLLAILPCSSEPELLLVAHGAQKDVDWRAWQQQVRQIAQLIENDP